MNYTTATVFPFEEDFDPRPSTVWMQRHWAHSITLSFLYAVFIFYGQKLMASRSNYSLKGPLTLWNGLLAVFSILGCIRMSPEFLHSLRTFGFKYSMCNASYAQGVTGYWSQMFAISKVVELGDTAFIILRKRPLIFLHWYHHITVLMYTWHAYKDHTAAGRWFIWMNYTVHAFMYTYFTARSAAPKLKLPKFIPMLITVLQITQMVVGCGIGVRAYQLKMSGEPCQQTYSNLYFSFLIYSTYFFLFAQFFYHAYLKRGNRYEKVKPAIHSNGVANGKDLNHNGLAKKVD